MFKPLVLFTDFHVKDNNLDLCESILHELDYYINDGCRPIFLGDWFTAREGQSQDIQNFSSYFIKELAAKGCRFLRGNHDKQYLDGQDGEPEKVWKNKNLSFLDVHTNIYFPQTELFGGLDFYNPDKYIEKLAHVNSKYLFTHIGVDGFLDSSPIKREMFRKFDIAFSGHYHNRKFEDNIYYIGSCYQGNFGEDDRKGFTIFDGKDIVHVDTKFPKFKTFYTNPFSLEEDMKFIEVDRTENKRVVIEDKIGGGVKIDTYKLLNKSIKFQIVKDHEEIKLRDIQSFQSFCEVSFIPETNYKIANELLSK